MAVLPLHILEATKASFCLLGTIHLLLVLYTHPRAMERLAVEAFEQLFWVLHILATTKAPPLFLLRKGESQNLLLLAPKANLFQKRPFPPVF